jgi:hypothetical protein
MAWCEKRREKKKEKKRRRWHSASRAECQEKCWFVSFRASTEEQKDGTTHGNKQKKSKIKNNKNKQQATKTNKLTDSRLPNKKERRKHTWKGIQGG